MLGEKAGESEKQQRDIECGTTRSSALADVQTGMGASLDADALRLPSARIARCAVFCAKAFSVPCRLYMSLS